MVSGVGLERTESGNKVYHDCGGCCGSVDDSLRMHKNSQAAELGEGDICGMRGP
jgi:hypothetical protein